MTVEEKKQWQIQVAAAIIHPADISAADKLQLLCSWPILRVWSQSMLRRSPEKVPPGTLDAYLRDALAWSGYLGSPEQLLDAQSSDEMQPSKDGNVQSAQSPKPTAVHTPSPAGAKDNAEDNAEDTPKQLQQRFEHMNEYRHMLPEEVSEREREIGNVFLQRSALGQRRDTLAELIEKATIEGEHIQRDAYEQDLAAVAMQLVMVDQGLRQYFTLVDACLQYYALNQVVMPMDELNKVRIKPTGPSRQRKPDYDKEQLDAMQFRLDSGTPREDDLSEDELKEAVALRQKRDKDFLRDARKLDAVLEKGGAALDEWRKNAKLRIYELDSWGIALNEAALSNIRRSDAK